MPRLTLRAELSRARRFDDPSARQIAALPTNLRLAAFSRAKVVGYDCQTTRRNQSTLVEPWVAVAAIKYLSNQAEQSDRQTDRLTDFFLRSQALAMPYFTGWHCVCIGWRNKSVH